jgi:hypothetical protein
VVSEQRPQQGPPARRQVADERPQRPRGVGADDALLGAYRGVGDSFWPHVNTASARRHTGAPQPNSLPATRPLTSTRTCSTSIAGRCSPAQESPQGSTCAWALDQLAEPLTVADLARHAGWAPRTFARHFAAETGTTPLRWLTAQRLLEAGDY